MDGSGQSTGEPRFDEAAHGQLLDTGHRALLRFSRRLVCRRRVLWGALTDHDELAQWFPTHVEGGFERLVEVTLRDRVPTARGHRALVFHLVPTKMLGLICNRAVLLFEVHPRLRDSCELEVIWAPGEARSASGHAAIWDASLDVLEHLVSGQPVPWTVRERLVELQPVWRERFGAQRSGLWQA